MNFSVDWFTPTIPRLEAVLPANVQRFVEIGCFEGRSTVWFLERWPAATAVVIDTFAGSSDIPTELSAGVRERFNENMQAFKDRVTVFAADSFTILPFLMRGIYDFVYVDGSHEAHDVFADGVMALQLLRPEGLLVFDDYGWPGPTGAATVKQGVDIFAAFNSDYVRAVPCDPYIATFRRL